MSEYAAFLQSKRFIVEPAGFEPESLNLNLFPFQASLTTWAVRQGRAALFATTGLGKTRMQLAWGEQVHRHTDGDVLILAPLAVNRQTVREGEVMGIAVTPCRSQADVRPGLNIANYEMLSHFDPAHFAGVVLDECFPKGTLVDTEDGSKPIECFRIGDELLNASGVDRVVDIHRREVNNAIKITISGRTILSSSSHPYFTRRGWVAAQDLRPGDYVVQTAAAMRLVRGGIHTEVPDSEVSAVLREILLSEMADAPTGIYCQGPHAGGSSEEGPTAARVVRVGQPQGRSRARANPQPQPDVQTGSTGEGLPPIERDGPQTFRAWGEWAGPHGATEDSLGCTWRGMDSGVCLVTGPADSWLSHELQDRLGESRAANRYRSGWTIPLQPQSGRREEGCEGAIARVDRLEVLEPGHPELERFREADGRIYFYDLGATRHPSFSVNGFLVHNSSVLKAYTGTVKRQLIAAFRGTPYRLCCTATPAPNDVVELCNHADFLSIMPAHEMISVFFTPKGNRTTGHYVLKRHARRAFYQWLASWAMSLTLPSDLGFGDDGYLLPPLEIKSVFVETAWKPAGQLLFTGLRGVTERSAARRSTVAERIQAALDLVRAEPGEPWVIWCGLNDEQDTIARELGGDAVSVYGSLSPAEKEQRLERWLSGEVKILLSKPTVAGFGLNMQRAARVVFVGLSDSYEQYFQAIRRCWRFGQSHRVQVHIVLSTAEQEVYNNVLRKEQEATAMSRELVAAVRSFEQAELAPMSADALREAHTEIALPAWLKEESYVSR